jgi:hypothetical protein
VDRVLQIRGLLEAGLPTRMINQFLIRNRDAIAEYIQAARRNGNTAKPAGVAVSRDQ